MAGERLAGKVALVTGAASGLGRASAEAFAAHGAAVACLDLDAGAAGAVAAAIEAAGGRALGLAADVTSESDLAAAVAATQERFGPITVAFANAGIAAEGRAHELALAGWERGIAVNLTGAFLTARAVLPGMLELGEGSIILQASIGGITGLPNIAAYAAAKGGVVALGRQMAAEYAPEGIRVNTIAPGTIRTALVEEAYTGRFGADGAEAALSEKAKSTPLRRLGKPEDIANYAVFLASDESNWVTGTVQAIDGGTVASSRVG